MLHPIVSHPYSIRLVKEIIKAKGTILREMTISQLVIDSRKISYPSQSLFFALKGRHDGHQYIDEAYQQGVRNFVVSDAMLLYASRRGANFLLVDKVLSALQDLATYHRNRFNLEVIGITGSKGKTIVKEWLYQLLAPEKDIIKNPKSYNSQIGVPLSIWQIGSTHNLGIFEAGISQKGEMDRLQNMIQANIGLLTHIDGEHDAGFSNRQEKIEEKLKLFSDCVLLIYNPGQLKDYPKPIPGKRAFTWSREGNTSVDLQITTESIQRDRVCVQGSFQNNTVSCVLPFTDRACIENAIICWATLLAMGYSQRIISQRLATLKPVNMRLKLKAGSNNCTIIDDIGHADIPSLEIALDFLGQQNQHAKKTLILSDIAFSSFEQKQLYQSLATLIGNKHVHKLIGVGPLLTAHKDLFAVPEQWFFKDMQDLCQNLYQLDLHDEAILLKGATGLGLERISKQLVQKTHETVLEINLNAVQNNLHYYQSKLLPGVRMMGIVKASSYGSGSIAVANLLQFNKVDYLAVAYIDEGITLRNAGIGLPIMVFNPELSACDQLIQYQLEPSIYSMPMLKQLYHQLKNKHITHYPVHIKIDTGTKRLGFDRSDMAALCQVLENNVYIQVQSVFSHLVASDDSRHDAYTLVQLERFEQAYRAVEKHLTYKVIKHISNTAAIHRWPNAQYDMVRLGIGLYGIDAALPKNTLQSVATLKSSITQIKKVKAGETIGYGRMGRLTKDGQVATVRIGYADGYLRAFGNGVGKMLVHGQLVPTVGNISMDVSMIDVSNVAVSEGDEVIIFNEQYPIEVLAEQIGTIPYEILTNISQRVKRVYFFE